MQARSRRTEITADMVLDRLWQIAAADPNDLVQYRRENCRYCWQFVPIQQPQCLFCENNPMQSVVVRP
ncbi:hypothetical protein BI344_17815 [Chromobacterium sphagni]|uniref:DUF35 domain-containing protein n=2 Tax=Chromobacterium sphagni TaxID=1903179 RepID=A0ABX3CC36_9NEIS|nr:hypothetical protein BI344_17815 [Chromobacterium sphagni]